MQYPRRRMEEWRPEPLLCKRFGFPDPYKGKAAAQLPGSRFKTDYLALPDTDAALANQVWLPAFVQIIVIFEGKSYCSHSRFVSQTWRFTLSENYDKVIGVLHASLMGCQHVTALPTYWPICRRRQRRRSSAHRMLSSRLPRKLRRRLRARAGQTPVCHRRLPGQG